jgi:flagellar motor switch/type III secretory pathway protein FliN
MEGLAVQAIPASQSIHETQEISLHSLLHPSWQLCESLQNGFQAFWNLSPRIKFFSVSPTPHYFWHMNDFYVAQKGLDEAGIRWAQLRLSEGLCQYMFETILGKVPEEGDFTLAQIRNFEVFLLERFSRKLFQIFSPALIQSSKLKTLPPEDDPMIHFVWAVEGFPEHASQIVLSLPKSGLNKPVSAEKPAIIRHPSEVHFMGAKANVKIQLGSSRVRLEELQNIQPEDVILFENSHMNHWELVEPHSGEHFRVSVTVPEHHRIPDLLVTQGVNAMTNETQVKQNLWDNLEVEVTATFNPIKLPLKQIREMEQGLVIEVGSLMDNQVSIEVEGHPVAWGELLVLGDRYGVRIQGLKDTPGPSKTSSSASGDMAGTAVQVAGTHPGQETHPQEETGGLMDLDLDESDFDDLDDDEDWT